MDAEPSPPAPCVQPALHADEAPSAEENLTRLALELQNPISSLIGVVTFEERPGVRGLTGQLFVSVNLPRGWYINTSPLVASANWDAGPARDVWTIPVGGGVGKVSVLDGQPINTLLAAYWNAIRPRDTPSPSWQLRAQLSWLFPR
jgi:hypothetical protein